MRRFATVLFAAACGGSEVPVTTAQCPCATVATAAPSTSAPAVVDAGVALAVVDAAATDAAIVDPQIARDLLLARVASTPLKTILSPPPPSRDPPRGPPTHDLEIRRPEPPHIYESLMRLSEGLPFEVVRRIARQNWGRFRLCYESERAEAPRKAKIVARFVIGRNGEVMLADPLTSDASAALTSCFTRGLQTLSFPPPDAVPFVVVELGMTFEP